jgi:hypothetical protein
MPHHEAAWDTPTSEIAQLTTENARLKSVIAYQSELATHQSQKTGHLAHNRKLRPVILSRFWLWLQHAILKNKKITLV